MTMNCVLTGNDIRAIRSALHRNGFECHVINGRDNEVILEMVWSDDDNAFEIALALIREVCPGINIRFMDGGACEAMVRVWY